MATRAALSIPVIVAAGIAVAVVISLTLLSGRGRPSVVADTSRPRLMFDPADRLLGPGPASG